MRRIGRMRVVEDLVLVRAVDDCGAALAEHLGRLTCRTFSSISILHAPLLMLAGLPMMGFRSGSKVVLKGGHGIRSFVHFQVVKLRWN